MIDVGLVALLGASSGLTALLKNGANSIFGVVTPEDIAQYPCISYQFVGGSSKPTFASPGTQRSRLQIDCWATDRLIAKQIADAVRTALNGYQGVLSDGTTISNAWLINPPGVDFFSGDSRFFRRMLEFYLLYDFTS